MKRHSFLIVFVALLVTLTFALGCGFVDFFTCGDSGGGSEVAGISVANPPERQSFNLGDRLDLTGGTISVRRADGTSFERDMMHQDVSMDVEYAVTEPIQSITLTYSGRSTSFDVFVTNIYVPGLTGIEVVTRPTTTSYEPNDTISLVGGTIRLNFSNGTSEVIPMTDERVLHSPQTATDFNANGDLTITVNVGTHTATFVVWVDDGTDQGFIDGQSQRPAGFTPTFYDNFRGNTLDLRNWAFQNGRGHEYGPYNWGNREVQSYEFDNVTVQEGMLRITARRQSGNRGAQFTSGKLVTTTHSTQPGHGTYAPGANTSPYLVPFHQTYGRFEARIRLRSTRADGTPISWTAEGWQGAWPAFWMMPTNPRFGGWPRSGEIDIMEMKGRFPRQYAPAIHFAGTAAPGIPGWHQYLFGHETDRWQGWQSGNNYGDIGFQNNETFMDWQIFGVDWEPGRIVFTLNGQRSAVMVGSSWDRSFRGTDNGTHSQWFREFSPFDGDFHLILNLALGGWFDGDRVPGILDNADGRLLKEVDWVRAYDLETARTMPGGFGMQLTQVPAAYRATPSNGLFGGRDFSVWPS